MTKLRQMFRMEPVLGVFGRSGAWDGSMHARTPNLTSGLVEGTKVATSTGWREVTALQEGDQVLTFDEGLRPVRGITRTSVYTSNASDTEQKDWPLYVPEGALGNKTGMILLPEQAVMVESDVGETMFGDPFTLIPANALEGYQGIERLSADQEVEVVVLHFDTEQVVFANIGALFHCPAHQIVQLEGMMEDRYMPGYEVLSMKKARVFVDALVHKDSLDAAWMRQDEKQRVLRYVA